MENQNQTASMVMYNPDGAALTDSSYNYSRNQTPIASLTDKGTLWFIMIILFAVLAYNFYYLYKKGMSGGAISKSVLWINLIAALATLALAAALYYANTIEVARWSNMMMTT